jgi:hypothetical protein
MELKNTRRRCSFFNLRRDLWDDWLHSVEIKTASVKGHPQDSSAVPFPAGESMRWTLKENSVGNCVNWVCLTRWVQFNERCVVSKQMLFHRRGAPRSVYLTVDDFVLVKASDFNKSGLQLLETIRTR